MSRSSDPFRQTEAQFQYMLIGDTPTKNKPQVKRLGLIRAMGGTVAHFRHAWTEKGYRTPVQGDGAGFPDLVIVTRLRTILYRELKSDTGRLTPEEQFWLDLLREAGQNAGIWRPRDLDLIRYELAH